MWLSLLGLFLIHLLLKLLSDLPTLFLFPCSLFSRWHILTIFIEFATDSPRCYFTHLLLAFVKVFEGFSFGEHRVTRLVRKSFHCWAQDVVIVALIAAFDDSVSEAVVADVVVAHRDDEYFKIRLAF